MAPMPKMLVSPETLEGLVAIPFEKPLYRDLNIIYPARPASAGGARAPSWPTCGHPSTTGGRLAAETAAKTHAAWPGLRRQQLPGAVMLRAPPARPYTSTVILRRIHEKFSRSHASPRTILVVWAAIRRSVGRVRDGVVSVPACGRWRTRVTRR